MNYEIGKLVKVVSDSDYTGVKGFINEITNVKIVVELDNGLFEFNINELNLIDDILIELNRTHINHFKGFEFEGTLLNLILYKINSIMHRGYASITLNQLKYLYENAVESDRETLEILFDNYLVEE